MFDDKRFGSSFVGGYKNSIDRDNFDPEYIFKNVEPMFSIDACAILQLNR